MIVRHARFCLVGLLIATALASVGCQGTSTATFDVSLHNESNEPVTVWLTKDGGPDEYDWLPPEALVGTKAAQLDQIKPVVIPGGKTGDIGPVAGKFDPDSLAVLRVYAGQLSLDQILATPVGKLRVDVPLREGANHLRVSEYLPLRVERIDDK